MSDNLELTQTIEATPETVYYALTHSTSLQAWLCDSAHIETREGGRLHLRWNDGYYTSGEYKTLQDNELVAFTWQGRGEPASTKVKIALASENGHTKVSVAHTGIGTGEAWGETHAELEKGWQFSLANLKSVVEDGLDQRVYGQPFLGVLISGILNAEQVAELGLDVEGGVQLSGTAPDTGAAAAGLQNGDILVAFNDAVVKDMPTLREALASFKVGDTIQVTLYRDSQKQTVSMVLSQRPVPVVPPTLAEFAQSLREIQAQLDAELDEVVQDVSEEAASYAPDDGWNARQVLAHLINVERSIQLSVLFQASGQVTNTFPSNAPVAFEAITAVYTQFADLVAAWKAAEAETVALIANLPEEFTNQKVTYLNIGNNLLSGLPGHARSHIAQIRAALEAAKNA